MDRCSVRVRALLVLATVIGLGVGLMAYSGYSQAQASSDQCEKHPHIQKALDELRDARKELKEADHDFGGHRVKAIEAIDGSIEQLKKCLEFDK
jgi:hypothetical protein